ncbi:MAG: hypothetical protein KDL31_00750 [Kiritimatiellae bacterium]|nr:hypothetical protein [Kiritimatiellia bacterium]
MNPQPATSIRTVYAMDFQPGILRVLRSHRSSRRSLTHEQVLPPTPVTSDPAVAMLQRIHAETLKGEAVSVMGLNSAELLTRRLTAPFPSAHKARQVYPSLLDLRIPFPVEDCNYALVEEGPTPEGGNACLAVAMRREDLTRWLDAMRQDSIDPMILDALPAALWEQATQTLPPGDTLPRALVWMGMDRMEIVLGRGTMFLQATGVPLTGESSIPPDRITSKLMPILRSVFPDASPETWWCCGPGLSREGGKELLSRALNIEPDRIHILPDPETYHLRAFAERLLTRGRAPAQLRSGPFEHEAIRTARGKERRRISMSILLATVVLCTLQIGWRTYAAMKQQALERDLQQRAMTFTGGVQPPRGQELLLAQRGWQTQMQQLSPYIEIQAPGITGLLEALMTTAGENGLRFESILLRPTSVILQGSAEDWYGAEALAPRLKQHGINLPTHLERKDAGSDERVHFTLRTTS